MPPPRIAPAKPALESVDHHGVSHRRSNAVNDPRRLSFRSLPHYAAASLLRFFVRCVLLAPAAIFLQLHPVWMGATVLRRRIVPALARGAAEGDDLAGHRLLLDLGDDAGAHRAAALADGEAQLLVHGHRHDQLD